MREPLFGPNNFGPYAAAARKATRGCVVQSLSSKGAVVQSTALVGPGTDADPSMQVVGSGSGMGICLAAEAALRCRIPATHTRVRVSARNGRFMPRAILGRTRLARLNGKIAISADAWRPDFILMQQDRGTAVQYGKHVTGVFFRAHQNERK